MSSPTSRAVFRCVAARVVRGRVPAAPGTLNAPTHTNESIDPSTASYRAAARRLRGRFAGDPVRLQHSLRDLARREDAGQVSTNRCADQAVRALRGMVDEEAAERF